MNMSVCLGRVNTPVATGVVSKVARSAVTSFTTTGKKMVPGLPYFAKGEIVRGFGRGSKELGIPTANFALKVVKALPPEFKTGAYYGWSQVDSGDVYKMVMSIGWNPYYDNKEKSMETHILHNYNRDLYGSILKVCIVGYIRPERNFDSLEALITTINEDILGATALLDKPENLQLKESDFFKDDELNGHDSTLN